MIDAEIVIAEDVVDAVTGLQAAERVGDPVDARRPVDEVARKGHDLRLQGVAHPHDLFEKRFADLAREVKVGKMDDRQSFQGRRQAGHVEAALGEVQFQALVAGQMDDGVVRMIGRVQDMVRAQAAAAMEAEDLRERHARSAQRRRRTRVAAAASQQKAR